MVWAEFIIELPINLVLIVEEIFFEKLPNRQLLIKKGYKSDIHTHGQVY